MKKISKGIIALSLVILISCGGSGGGTATPAASGNTSVDVGTGTGNGQNDTQSASTAALSVVSGSFSKIFGTSNTSSLVKAVPQWASVNLVDEPCTDTGTYSITGDYTQTGDTYNYDFTSEFNNCDGLDGSITYSGTYTYTDEDNYDYSYTTNGTYGGYGCSMTYNDLVYNYSAVNGTETATYNGGITASCGEFEYSCTFDNADATDPGTAYGNNCTLTDEEGTTVDANDPSAFFEAIAGTHDFVARDGGESTGDPTSDTTFTHDEAFSIAISADGKFTIETNGGSVVFDYYASSNESVAYEAYSHEDYVIIVANGVRFLFQRHFGDFAGLNAQYIDAANTFADQEFAWFLNEPQ